MAHQADRFTRSSAEILSLALAELGSGHGGIVLIGGPAGIGKTRMADRALEQARADGLSTGRARPLPGAGADRPFGLWRRAVARLGAPPWPDSADTPTAAAIDGARAHVLDAVQGPTVLLLDDAHHADQASLWLLQQISDDLDTTPLLVLVSGRSTDHERTEDLAGVRQHPQTSVIDLSPWPAEAVAALLAEHLPAADVVGDAGPIAAHPIVLLADGIPGTALELAARWATADGRDRVEEQLAQRIRATDPHGVLAALAALQAPLIPDAPVSGERSLLLAVADATPEEVDRVLGWADGLALTDREGERVSFTHPLHQPVAVRADPSAHRDADRRLAAQLSARGLGTRPSPAAAEIGARQLRTGAVDSGVAVVAARWLLDSGAPVSALDMLEAALASDPTDREDHGLDRLAAEALARLGRHEEAARRVELTVDRAQGDPVATVVATTALLLCSPTVPDHRRQATIDGALDLVDEVGPHDAVALRAAASGALRHHDPRRAAELVEEADALARGVGDPQLVATALIPRILLGSQASLGRVDAAAQELESLDHSSSHGRAWAAMARLAIALAHGTRDDVEHAYAHAQSSVEATGDTELAAYLAVARFGLLRFDADADGVTELAASEAWAHAPPASHASLLLGVGHLLWERALGPLPELADAAQRVMRIDAPRARRSAEFTALGISAHGDPDLQGTLRERLDALAPKPEAIPRDFRWSGELIALAAFAGNAGDIEMAQAAADLLTPHLEEMTVVLPTGMAGPVGLHVAHARIAGGDLQAATEAVEAGLRCARRLRAWTWAAMCHQVVARIAVLDHRFDDAGMALAEADRALQGMSVPVQRQWISRLREQISQTRDETSQAVLSDREREVLRRVAVGATNRMVARDLQISPKTVEYHLAGAFKSLGAGNRTEAVELARRHRLL